MKYKVTLNDKVYEVVVEKGEAILASEYAVSASVPAVPAAPIVPAPVSAPVATPVTAVAASVVSGEGVVTSPLPGSIFDVKVKVGDTVKSGDILFIIEAMKMENEVLAAAGGKVAQILVNKGDTVETGTTLLVFEDAAPVVPVSAPAPVVAPAPAAVAAPAVAATAPAVGDPVDSPLPGSIFDVKAKVGDSVNAGDVLFIIEAMKMENEVVAPRAGRVAQVAVNKGDTVETGTLLLVME